MRRIAFSVLLLILASCATLPPVSELPPENTIQRIGPVSVNSMISWHPDSVSYAVSAGGLSVGKISSASERIDRRRPNAIAWSPTGSFLAAAFPDHSNSVINILDAVDWSPLAEIPVAGQVNDLAWVKDDELVFAATSLKTFNFGGNFSVRLYRWRQNHELTDDVIVDTSILKPTLDKIDQAVLSSVHLQISPYRDEIALTRFRSTPNAGTYYQLVVRHLESGAERDIARLAINSRGARYTGQGDSLFYSDGRYQSIAGSIWGTESYETFPPGSSLEISPGGRYKIIDTTLFQDREPHIRFESLDTAAFSPDGKKLLFAAGRDLYLVSPFMDHPVSRPQTSQRLLDLRRWRSEGLITPQEFKVYVQQMEEK